MTKKLFIFMTIGLFAGYMKGQQKIEVYGDAIFPGGDEALVEWVEQNVILPTNVHKIVGSKPYNAIFNLTIDFNGKVTKIKPTNKITQRDISIYECLEEKMQNIPLFMKESGISKKISIYIYGHGNSAIFRPSDKMGSSWLTKQVRKTNACKPTKKAPRSFSYEDLYSNKISDIADADFFVDETGKLTDISVKCKTNPKFAEFLQNALLEMPLWIPSTKGDTPISQKKKIKYYLYDLGGATIGVSVD